MSDNLIVRVNITGRASPRWRGVSNPSKADRLNQQLSETRAQNLRKPVEDILRRELPGIKIEVPAQGIGSHHGFPLTGEDNDAIDRSVVVEIALTTTIPGTITQQRPVKIYTPSRYWKMRVTDMIGARAGIARTFMRIMIVNFFTQRELTLAGYLIGGNFSPNLNDLVGLDARGNPTAPIGNEVTFVTNEAEDFSYFVGTENGQWVRLIHAAIGAVRKRETTFLQFTNLDTNPGSLVFEYSKGWTWAKLQVGVLTGILHVVGDVPSDYVDDTTLATIPTQDIHTNYDGLLVSFPTGKAGWGDLTLADQRRLTDFVTNKARNIAALGQSGFSVTNWVR